MMKKTNARNGTIARMVANASDEVRSQSTSLMSPRNSRMATRMCLMSSPLGACSPGLPMRQTS